MAGIQILVVEDDVMQAKLVSFLLGEAGHTVEIVGSAEKALEILKKLRRNLAMRRIPVLMLTARSQASAITQGYGSGANDYVIKPGPTPSRSRLIKSRLATSRN